MTEKQRMFVWGRNIYLVQLLSAATPGMTSPVRKRVPVGQICNRLQAQMDSETGTTSTPLSPNGVLFHWQFWIFLFRYYCGLNCKELITVNFVLHYGCTEFCSNMIASIKWHQNLISMRYQLPMKTFVIWYVYTCSMGYLYVGDMYGCDSCMGFKYISLKSASDIISQISPLTHWGRDKMDAISQTTFSSAFS